MPDVTKRLGLLYSQLSEYLENPDELERLNQEIEVEFQLLQKEEEAISPEALQQLKQLCDQVELSLIQKLTMIDNDIVAAKKTTKVINNYKANQ